VTSISAAAPVQSPSPSPQSSNASSSSSTQKTQSFASHLKESGEEEGTSSTTEPLQGVKKVPPKDEKEAGRQKPSAPGAAILSAPVSVQQIQDPRSMLLSWNKPNETSGGGSEASTAVRDAANSAVSAHVAATGLISQKGQLAFSVALPNAALPKASGADKAAPALTAGIAPLNKAAHNEKNSAGGKQSSDTSDSNDPKSAKAAALESTPKVQTSESTTATANTPAGIVTGAQANQFTPYSDAHLGKTTSPAAAAEVVKTADLPPTPVSRPPQSIDLKVSGADNSQVDVRVSQRAGDVQVTVRTPDGDLAQSLRQHLPELSDRLAQSGVGGEILSPATAQASTDTTSNQESWNSDQSEARQQQQQRNHNGQPNQPQDENGSSNWRNEFNNAEKEDR
jgi:hypothetical protein